MKKPGYSVGFISKVGRDEAGEAIRMRIADAGFFPEDIGIDPDHDTGRVWVSVDESGSPSFRIVSNMAYDFIAHDEHVDASLIRADILKLNNEELQTAARLLGIPGEGDMLVETLMKTFDISVTALTHGAAGSCL